MEVRERDPFSGRETTGHEWNGIKELDTPVPRGVLMFLIVTHIWAIVLWFFVPSWPLGTTYTKGLLGTDQRQTVEAQLVQAQRGRSGWMSRIEKEDYNAILADEALMQTVRSTGRQLFGDNCAACHGRDGKGGANYPDLTDDDWLWGAVPRLSSRHARRHQHPASGKPGRRDARLRTRRDARPRPGQERRGLCLLADPSRVLDATKRRTDKGRAEVFVTACAACHGEDAKGSAT